MRNEDLAEEYAHRFPKPLGPPDMDRVERMKAELLPPPRKTKQGNPCPVCQAQGYRRINRMADDLVFVCRLGHPHYVPKRGHYRALNHAEMTT